MTQAFVIMLREGFEAFLIVSIIAAYLQKTGRGPLLQAVYWGVAVSIAASIGCGFLLHQSANQPFWEGVLGLVAAVFVTTLVVQMWTQGSFLKDKMEKRIAVITAEKPGGTAWWGVFVFTVVMIAREGMETALMLIQVPEGRVFAGVALGALAVIVFCLLWIKFSSLINLRLFFQVTGIFLLIFVAQILIYSFHEFTEAGILPNSEALHLATEPFSPDGQYGRWFAVFTVGICTAWLLFAWLKEKTNVKRS